MADSLLQAAARFTAFSANVKFINEGVALEWCLAVLTRAKEVLGTYAYGWPPLAESTLKKKQEDTPLLETGELFDSLEFTVEPTRGIVGSNLDRAVWHELGTYKIPPRSFLRESAVRSERELHKIVTKYLASACAGRNNEILHLISAIRAALEIMRGTYRAAGKFEKRLGGK
jgi:phage gpG-like protein